MAAICQNFKWLGFGISDPIGSPEQSQPNLYLTIQNPDKSGFQIPTYCFRLSDIRTPTVCTQLSAQASVKSGPPDK